MKPRDYQKEAAKIAKEKERSVFVLPTGTGKTYIGLLWIDSLLKDRKIKKAIVLEPTRILVEQVYNFYRMLGKNPTKIYGILPKEKRRDLWRKSKIVITTPETAYNDLEFSMDFDAVVVDEAHHSVGDDFYAKFLSKSLAKYRLGLSAFIPNKKKKEIEKYIGEIIEWGYNDERIRKYIPDFILDIYEAPFNREEMKLYRVFEDKIRYDNRNRILWRLASKFFSRDGALALKDSLKRKTRLSKLLKEYEDKILSFRDLHKFNSLINILDTFPFQKAIIFVDRVAVAKKLRDLLKSYNPVLILGKRRGEEVRESLEEAKREESRVIISTSAGEEGVDIPVADLLINWSNVINPVRFIQRYGRVLRKTKPIKFITHIITPDTIDVDAFLRSILRTRKYINLGDEIFQKVFEKSRTRDIMEILRSPIDLDTISKLLFIPRSDVLKVLKFFMEKGDVVYFYAYKKLYIRADSIEEAYKEYPEYFSIDIDKLEFRDGKRISGSFNEVLQKLLKRLPILGLKVYYKKFEEGIETIFYRNYKFLIKNKEILEFVLRNSFCSKSWKLSR